MINITIPGMTLPNTANRREHYMARARRVKRQRATVSLLLAQPLRTSPLVRTKFVETKPGTWKLYELAAPVVVTITRHAPRAYDSDGLVICAKSVRDQVAEELGVDDADPRVTWVVAHAKCVKGAEHVTITIEPVRAKALPRKRAAKAGAA